MARRRYPSGIKVSDAEFERIRIVRNTFHGEWNYRIDPHDRNFVALSGCNKITLPLLML